MIDRFAQGQARAATRPGAGTGDDEPVAAGLDRPAPGSVGGDPVLDVVRVPLVLALDVTRAVVLFAHRPSVRDARPARRTNGSVSHPRARWVWCGGRGCRGEKPARQARP